MTAPKKGNNWLTSHTSSSASVFSTFPPAICQKELVITYVETPSTFWGTLASQLGKQIDIENKLSNVCESLPRLKNTPKFGKMYACKYSFDGLWYRCKVTQPAIKNHVEVLYVDYGNREVVSTASLVELSPDIADIHVLAYPYWLLRVKNDQSDEAIERGIEFMEELKNSSSLNATLYSKTRDGVIPVTVVLDSGEDLSGLLVNKRICSYMNEEEMRVKFNSTVPEGGSRTRVPTTKSSGSAGILASAYGGPPGLNKEKMFSRPSRAPASPIADLSTSPSITAKSSFRNKSKSPVKLLKLNSAADREYAQTEYDLTSKMDEVDLGSGTTSHVIHKNLELGIEQLSCELAESTNDVLYLQLTNNNLRRELEECRAQVAALEKAVSSEENSSSYKMKRLVTQARKVAKTRKKVTKQNELKFELDRLGDIMLSLQPSSPMLRKIQSVKAVYDNLQRKIRSKMSKDEELIKLMSARDSARKLLHHDLDEFLEKVTDNPLEEIYAKIKVILSDLSIGPDQLSELDRRGVSGAEGEDSCNCDLDDDQFQSAMLTYRTWRIGGLKDHRFIQVKMDDKKQQITQALSYVVKILREEEVAESAREEVVISQIDDVMDEFLQTAEEEITYMVKELGESGDRPGPEGEAVPSETSPFWGAVEGLLVEVRRIVEVVNKYRGLKEDLSAWLDRAPDLRDLRNVLRNIRCYKSQLRHLLADHADLEEEKLTKNAPSNAEDRMGLITKLDNTRCILQERLELENQILMRMMVSDLRHFPELVLFHPDIPFRNLMNFGPIVKHGRSLDQYTLEPFKEEPNTYKSMYLGKPVLLKESYLRGMSPEQLESFVNQYLSIFEDPLAPSIDFIFFDSKKVTVVVQSTFKDITLARMIMMGSDEIMLLCVLYNILSCLNDMHRKGIVHGCVNPSNVFYDSDTWTAFLRPPDLTLSSYERAKDNFWNVWRYVAPEVTQGASQVTTAVDMYSFGVLLYQVHRPNQPFELYTDITSILGMEPQSCKAEMIRLLLNIKPEERPNAETLLKTQFWQDVARDYEKGRRYILKPPTPSLTAGMEQRSPMCGAVMAVMEAKPSIVEGKPPERRKQRVKQNDQERQEYELESDGDESAYSDRRGHGERRKAPRVKFATEEERIYRGDDDDDDYDDEVDDENLEEEEDEDVMAVHRMNGVVLDDLARRRRRRRSRREDKDKGGKMKQEQESAMGDYEDYVSSDGYVDVCDRKRDETSDASVGSALDDEGRAVRLPSLGFAQKLPSLEQRISGITRQLNSQKFCSSEDENTDL